MAYTCRLKHESYVFDPRPKYPLLITANRYWDPEHTSTDSDALTLIFAHGTGYHKEHWEPTLDHLYALLARANNNKVKIREAWSIDCPNHGDAAILNEEVLTWGYLPTFSWEEYARSIHMFLAGLGTGVDVDFTKRRLVGIGHSMGAISLMLVNTYMPTIEFASLVLVDPMLVRDALREDEPINLHTPAERRRDIWPSFDEALKSLQSRGSFKIWDPRVLEVYVRHGMRPLPTSTYPDKTDGVTLKCPKLQEAACYKSDIGRVRAYNYLHTLCVALPVHIIYGAINDYLPEFIHTDVLDVAAKRQYATVNRVAGAGHLIPQLQPARLADAIWTAFNHDVAHKYAPGGAGGSYAVQSNL
ncbi:hypothetical protein PHLGIDRAFT_111245 [Phlebiopsis gigantea 11061_1 CR5-6]|uniref:AB hydrolase-1 domain-containing protein n=1 Tax=Phlebiopsis gigantea (strain 11061_1 CR5-6) TaxID=745531 RepID=A0A0C3NER0_PHLG1|nr:hypothetical protein PHLGIDRAFT_111245 [Phlebiopsis gigantea 11061_1 CR5-6]